MLDTLQQDQGLGLDVHQSDPLLLVLRPVDPLIQSLDLVYQDLQVGVGFYELSFKLLDPDDDTVPPAGSCCRRRRGGGGR